jgi:hypothetical protein
VLIVVETLTAMSIRISGICSDKKKLEKFAKKTLFSTYGAATFRLMTVGRTTFSASA